MYIVEGAEVREISCDVEQLSYDTVCDPLADNEDAVVDNDCRSSLCIVRL